MLTNQISPRNGQLHTADIGNVERDIKHIIEQNNDIKESLLERRECVSIPIQVNQDRKTEQVNMHMIQVFLKGVQKNFLGQN